MTPTLIGLAGLALLTIGAGLIYLPAGVIVAGTSLLVLARIWPESARA